MENNDFNQNTDQGSDELQDLLSSLDKQAGAARPEFEGGLYHAYISQAGKGRGSASGLWNLLTSKWTIAGAVGVTAIVFGALFVMRGMNPTNQPDKLTPQTKEVLRQVLTNNPQVVLNLQNSANPSSVVSIPVINQPSNTSTSSSTTTSAAVDYQMLKSFNYSYIRNVIDFGAAKDKCAVFSTGEEGVFETYHYYDGNKNYFKSLVYDTGEELQDYYLQLPEYYIHFKQGDFAAKVALDEDDNETSSSTTQKPSSSLNSAESEKVAVDFFGEDVEVSDIQDEGGKKFYEIILKHEVDCGQTAAISDQATTTSSASSSATSAGSANSTTSSTSSAATSISSTSSAQSTTTKSNKQTIVSVARVDAETYEMFAELAYLNEVSDKNLIRAMEIEQDTRSVTFQDIEKIFTFDYEASIEEYVKGDAPEVSTEDVLKLINDNNIPVIWAENGKATIEHVYTQDTWKTETLGTEYLLEREFYPEGDAGDEMYKEVMKTESAYLQKDPMNGYLLSIDYTWSEDDNRMMSVSMFGPDVKLDNLAKEILKSDKVEELKGEVISFTESRVNARVIAAKKGVTDYDQRIYLFTWNDMNYVVIFDPITAFTDKQRQDSLNFEVLNMQNKVDLDKLEPQLTAALEAWYEQN